MSSAAATNSSRKRAAGCSSRRTGADALAHGVDGIGEWEETVNLLVDLRQQLDGERAGGSGDLHDHDDHHQRLAHVAEGQGQRVDQQAEGEGSQGRRQVQQARVLALDAQQVQVAGDNDGRLYSG